MELHNPLSHYSLSNYELSMQFILDDINIYFEMIIVFIKTRLNDIISK